MTFIRIGYALMIFVLLLMLRMSSTGAENFCEDCQPCTFNPLCSCSKSYDSLGEVRCIDVYFPRVPPAINQSKLSTLYLNHNDLDTIEPYFFFNSGNPILFVKCMISSFMLYLQIFCMGYYSINYYNIVIFVLVFQIFLFNNMYKFIKYLLNTIFN